VSEIKALLSKAAALHNSGQLEPALNLYEGVFQRTLASGRASDMAEATRRIGYAYQWSGNIEVATEYLELAYTIARLHDDRSSAARALNGLATIYQVSGQISLAAASYDVAASLARDAGDDLTAADIDQNLGTLYNTRGNLDQAMRHYEASLARHKSIGNRKGVAQVLNNMGVLYLDRGALDEAAQCLDTALNLCEETSDRLSAAPVFLNRAEVFIGRHDYIRARSCCDEAYEIAAQAEDSRTLAEALKYYGIIYRETGKLQLAGTHLQQAIEIATKYSLPLTEAEARRELALVCRGQNRNKEALEALNAAHLLFTSLQARNDQAEVSSRLLQLERDFLSIVTSWGVSIEEKDQYTKGHCQRVADYACMIAEEAGISHAEMVWFRMGAFLHDVGKMEVPPGILHKQGSLTPQERAIIEQHTVKGDEMLSEIAFPWDVRPMVRSHHERWDGRGYPDGLMGDQIPLVARILRIADVYDALTTTRSYRSSLSAQEAREVMRLDDGAFDPSLLEIFDALFPRLRELTIEYDDRDGCAIAGKTAPQYQSTARPKAFPDC
jgi:putative nucleotidyltransferase with HDIG domain